MSEPNATHASKYDQIVEAAVAEFQENGFAAASMDRVSTRANVSKRTVYKYFVSKEKLFQSIVERLSNRIAEVVDVTYRPGVDVRQQLTELAEAEGRILTSPEVMGLARLVTSEVLRSPELAEATQMKLELRGVFENMLRAAHEDGQLAVDDPAQAAEEFVGLLKTKAFWPVIFGAPIITQDEMRRVIASSVEMMMCRYARH